MIDLYRNIKELRIKNGWSQSELAKRAGYKDRSAIAHIEDGTIDLPQSKIKLFADIFGVTPAILFGGSGYEISDSDRELLSAYHSAPSGIQESIRKLLDIRQDAGLSAFQKEA